MKSEMEDREWINEYPGLKQVNAKSPFTVPDGYFDGLAERINASITIDKLKDEKPSDGFTVPEGYFNELNSNINSRIKIEGALQNSNFTVPENYFEELNSKITSRIFVEEALKADGGLTVPENYFDNLSNEINSRVFVEEALNAETGLSVPENYFENLSNQINSRIFVEETLNETEESFAVPQGYFAQLNADILDKTVNKQTTKRKAKKQKGIVVRMFTSVAFKYATAACLVLTVGTGLFIKQANAPTPAHNVALLHKQLAKVSAQDIQNYLDVNVDDAEKQRNATSDGVSVNVDDLNDALQNYSTNIQ